jgi:hypothetical protein
MMMNRRIDYMVFGKPGIDRDYCRVCGEYMIYVRGKCSHCHPVPDPQPPRPRRPILHIPDPAARTFVPQRRAALVGNDTTYPVEADVPLRRRVVRALEDEPSAAYSSATVGRRFYPFAKMNIGDSFIVPPTKGKIAACAAYRYGARHHKRYTSRVMPEGVRIWRLS